MSSPTTKSTSMRTSPRLTPRSEQQLANELTAKAHTTAKTPLSGKGSTPRSIHKPASALQQSSLKSNVQESKPQQGDQQKQQAAKSPTQQQARENKSPAGGHAARPTAPTPSRAVVGKRRKVSASSQALKAPAATAAPAFRSQVPADVSKAAATDKPIPSAVPAAAIATIPTARAQQPAGTAPPIIKTHQRRHSATAVQTGLTAGAHAHAIATPAAAGKGKRSVSGLAAKTAPAAVKSKKRPHTGTAAAAAHDSSAEGSDHSPTSDSKQVAAGANKRRRTSMPAGRTLADPDEMKYWQEVEQEQLITESGSSSDEDL